MRIDFSFLENLLLKQAQNEDDHFHGRILSRRCRNRWQKIFNRLRRKGFTADIASAIAWREINRFLRNKK